MFLFILKPLVHASTPIVFDSSAASECTSCSSLTWSHTVGSGINGILIVAVSDTNNAPATSVKFGAASLSPLGSHFAGGVNVELWSLLNPPSGAATITVTFSVTISCVMGGSVSYFNVAGTGTVVSAEGFGTAASVTVSSSNTGDVVVDRLGVLNTVTATTVSPIGSGQTQRWNSGPITDGHVFCVGAGSDEPDSPPVTTTWSISPSSSWSLIAVLLTPAATIVPEYSLGIPLLVILMIVGYGLVKRKAVYS